ncbi:MAG: L,D-transpeptidase [Timaviella obliquedivisa GSE-PSE-MK23-08B]|nr:L,D-transpeptidase [Timaviella obliquedivisa GSE-PSE-MK23-08B]
MPRGAIAQTIPASASGSASTSANLSSAQLKPLLDSLLALSPSSVVEVPELGGANRYLPSPNIVAKVHLLIRLSDRRVYVYDRDKVTTSFPIAIGRSGWETPAGKFQVIDKIIDPAWQNPFTGEIVSPGNDNPLGSRWIGFWTDGANYIGFHGTPNPESVGTSASHGCIRMYDKDVVSLFEIVRVGTPVEVVP